MAAIITIEEHNTSTPDTRTNKTGGTVRCRASDSSVVDANAPLIQPLPSQFTRSYEKWLKFRIGATGPVGNISNLLFYVSAGPGTGASVYVRTVNPAVYATPAIPANDVAGTNVTAYPVGAPKSMGVGPYTGTNVNIGNFLVLWMTLNDTVTPQVLTSNTNLFFSYDET